MSVLLGNSNVLKDIKDKYDVITANINRNILLADMHMFKQKMSAGAVLILSGFYTSDTEILVEKAKSLKLTLIDNNSKTIGACSNLKIWINNELKEKHLT